MLAVTGQEAAIPGQVPTCHRDRQLSHSRLQTMSMFVDCGRKNSARGGRQHGIIGTVTQCHQTRVLNLAVSQLFTSAVEPLPVFTL